MTVIRCLRRRRMRASAHRAQASSKRERACEEGVRTARMCPKDMRTPSAHPSKLDLGRRSVSRCSTVASTLERMW